MNVSPRALIEARMSAEGHHCPADEIDRLIPVLEKALPLIAALRSLPLDEVEPAVGFEMGDKR